MQVEQELVSRILDGEAGAEQKFLAVYRPRLYRICAQVLGEQDSEAAAAVDEAFAEVLPRLKDLDFGAPVQVWLRQVCLSRCYARLRSRQQRLQGEEEDLELYMRRFAIERLKELQDQLNPASRLILELRHGQGQSYVAISATLHIPIGTVMSRLSRARDQLRQLAERQPEVQAPQDQA